MFHRGKVKFERFGNNSFLIDDYLVCILIGNRGLMNVKFWKTFLSYVVSNVVFNNRFLETEIIFCYFIATCKMIQRKELD
jgi:hypothetical protein